MREGKRAGPKRGQKMREGMRAGPKRGQKRGRAKG